MDARWAYGQVPLVKKVSFGVLCTASASAGNSRAERSDMMAAAVDIMLVVGGRRLGY